MNQYKCNITETARFNNQVGTAADTNNEVMIDELCIGWLKKKSTSHGKNGDVAFELLSCVAKLLDIGTNKN